MTGGPRNVSRIQKWRPRKRQESNLKSKVSKHEFQNLIENNRTPWINNWRIPTENQRSHKRSREQFEKIFKNLQPISTLGPAWNIILYLNTDTLIQEYRADNKTLARLSFPRCPRTILTSIGSKRFNWRSAWHSAATGLKIRTLRKICQ